jgi:hypothetical protein
LALRLLVDFLAQRFAGEVAPWDEALAQQTPRTKPDSLRN